MGPRETSPAVKGVPKLTVSVESDESPEKIERAKRKRKKAMGYLSMALSKHIISPKHKVSTPNYKERRRRLSNEILVCEWVCSPIVREGWGW